VAAQRGVLPAERLQAEAAGEEKKLAGRAVLQAQVLVMLPAVPSEEEAAGRLPLEEREGVPRRDLVEPAEVGLRRRVGAAELQCADLRKRALGALARSRERHHPYNHAGERTASSRR
jgi:hypothetical protein